MGDCKKIYRITCSISEDAFKFQVKEVTVQKETDKMYECVEGGSKRKIKKKHILDLEYYNLVKSGMYDYIFESTYCLEEQIEQAKKIILKKVKEEVERRMSTAEAMHKLIQKGPDEGKPRS